MFATADGAPPGSALDGGYAASTPGYASAGGVNRPSTRCRSRLLEVVASRAARHGWTDGPVLDARVRRTPVVASGTPRRAVVRHRPRGAPFRSRPPATAGRRRKARAGDRRPRRDRCHGSAPAGPCRSGAAVADVRRGRPTPPGDGVAHPRTGRPRCRTARGPRWRAAGRRASRALHADGLRIGLPTSPGRAALAFRMEEVRTRHAPARRIQLPVPPVRVRPGQASRISHATHSSGPRGWPEWRRSARWTRQPQRHAGPGFPDVVVQLIVQYVGSAQVFGIDPRTDPRVRGTGPNKTKIKSFPGPPPEIARRAPAAPSSAQVYCAIGSSCCSTELWNSPTGTAERVLGGGVSRPRASGADAGPDLPPTSTVVLLVPNPTVS